MGGLLGAVGGRVGGGKGYVGPPLELLGGLPAPISTPMFFASCKYVLTATSLCLFVRASGACQTNDSDKNLVNLNLICI